MTDEQALDEVFTFLPFFLFLLTKIKREDYEGDESTEQKTTES